MLLNSCVVVLTRSPNEAMRRVWRSSASRSSILRSSEAGSLVIRWCALGLFADSSASVASVGVGPEKVPTPAVWRTLPVRRSDACLPREYCLTHCRQDGYDCSVVSSHPAGQLQRGAIESAPFLITLIVRLASRARR